MTQPSRRRPLLALLATLLGAALTATLTVGPLTAPAAALQPPGLSILVLGDSYSAGNGAGNYSDAVCYRSPDNYAGQFAALVDARSGLTSTVTNLACSGAKTTDFWNQQGGALDPQFTAVANNPDADLVFLTIGGNDLGFSSIVQNCLLPQTDNVARCKTSLRTAERLLTNGTIRTRLKRVLKGIHARASATTRVVLLGYPYLEGDKTLTFGKIKLGRRLKAMEDKGDRIAASLTSTLNTNLTTHNFVFVKTKKLFAGQLPWLSTRNKAHHELFKKRLNKKRWMVQPLRDSTNVYEWYHPNPKGWHQTAELLFRQKATIPHQPLGDNGAWTVNGSEFVPLHSEHSVVGGVGPFSATFGPGGDTPPAWLTLSNTGRTLILDAPAPALGTWNLEITVTDGTGNTTVVSVNLTVSPVV